MKNRFFFIALLFSLLSFSQTIVTGIVYGKNGPLEGAAVYFNNTMLGTTTNEKGQFSIPTKKGHYNLVISYLGYRKLIYSLNTSTYKEPLVFTLQEEKNTLDEIIIKKTVYNADWKYNLSRFKRQFIGSTILAKDCKILNPKVLHFNFNAKQNILTAIARKPLEIQHKGLGYKITYDLEEFTIHKNRVTYLGYARYKHLNGSKRKKRIWAKNRQKAYNGSSMHFYQTLLKKTTYEEGFFVHLFKRVPNLERPSELAIKRARELVKLNNTTINFSAKIKNHKTELDTAILTLRKVKLPKFKDRIYKTKASLEDVILMKKLTKYLNFDFNILVVYTKELEEKGYIMRNSFSKNREPNPQSSSIIGIKIPTAIDNKGSLVSPLDVFYEGYWSYEKFADSLPLDYVKN